MIIPEARGVASTKGVTFSVFFTELNEGAVDGQNSTSKTVDANNHHPRASAFELEDAARHDAAVGYFENFSLAVRSLPLVAINAYS